MLRTGYFQRYMFFFFMIQTKFGLEWIIAGFDRYYTLKKSVEIDNDLKAKRLPVSNDIVPNGGQNVCAL